MEMSRYHKIRLERFLRGNLRGYVEAADYVKEDILQGYIDDIIKQWDEDSSAAAVAEVPHYKSIRGYVMSLDFMPDNDDD